MSCRTRFVVGSARVLARTHPQALAWRALWTSSSSSPPSSPSCWARRPHGTTSGVSSSLRLGARQYSTGEPPRIYATHAIESEYFIEVVLDRHASQGLPAEIDDTLFLPKAWLRDICPCPACVSPSSGQKRFASCVLPPALKTKRMTFKSDGALVVRWKGQAAPGPGGPHSLGHRSIYPMDYLVSRYLVGLKNGGEATPPAHLEVKDVEDSGRDTEAGAAAPQARVLWDREVFERGLEARHVEYSDWMEGGSAFAQAIRTLSSYGLVVVKNVPESETSVQQVAERIGPIMDTFYGRTWDVVSKPDAENVAYTNDFLCLHQDLLYHDPVPKIQLLHCLKNECKGGESLFSDGLVAAWHASMVRTPYAADLETHRLAYWYTKNGNDRYRTHPIVDATGHHPRLPLGVNWSPPFQAPLPLAPLLAHGPGTTTLHPPSGHHRFVAETRSARRFMDAVEAPRATWEYKMAPGDCVVFDNRRVLHGRTRFDVSGGGGERHLRGCYLDEPTYERVRARHAGPGVTTGLGPRERGRVWRAERDQMRALEVKREVADPGQYREAWEEWGPERTWARVLVERGAPGREEAAASGEEA